MSIRGKLLFPIAIVLVVLPLCAGRVFAFGQHENQLLSAQQLIKEKKYNDAILVLTKVMKNHPQEFDRAQSLLLKIDKARNLYNEKLAELIKVFNAGNLEAAYKIIKELEALDRAPNKRTLEAQAYARQTATYVYDTKRFQAIMDQALGQLKSGDYTGAVKTYLSGFDLGMGMFKQAGYGNIVVNKISGLREDIVKASDQFAVEIKRLDAQRSAINGKLGEPAALDAPLAEFFSALTAVDGLEKRIEKDSLNLKIEQQSIVLQRSRVRSVPLISFLDRLVHGRANASRPEGILVAMNDAFSTAVGSVHGELQKRALAEFVAGRKSYQAGSWQQAGGQFGSAKSYALLAERAASAWGMRLDMGSSLSIPTSGWAIIHNKLPQALDDQLIAQAADAYVALFSPSRTIHRIAGSDAKASLAELGRQRQEIVRVSTSLRAGRSAWNARKGRYAALQGQKLDLAPALGRINDLLTAYDALLAKGDNATVIIVAREGNLRMTPVADKLAVTKSTVEKATNLLNGVAPSSASGAVAAALKEKYPGQARQLLEKAQGELKGYAKTVADENGVLSQLSPSVVDSQAVKKLAALTGQLHTEITGLLSTVSDSIAQAGHQVFQAARYRQEGENNLQLARNDLSRHNFAAARQEITAAATSLDRSLSFQENAAVKRIRNGEIPRLSKQITDAQNAIVVHQVRTYINRGRSLYSQGNYSQAQDMFLRAQARWQMTNSSSNPEITTWLKYVDTALSINSGRVVSPTDPLYPEITQVLNLARDDYNRAKQLISAGDTAKARALLSQAQTKLIYVQIPFPLNKDARVLSLRILKLSDPKTFNATFKQKFDKAVGELRSNAQGAYIALKDLQAIDSSYPGLSHEIYRAEILTGMRRPPPDPAKITQSKSLYQKAFDIVRQNVRAQYPIALSYLNKAIELDPNNQQATVLKDRIAIDEGAATTVVMSSTDQAQFKLAQEQFVAKNYYEALRIVNQLLKVPANEHYSPLVQLKRRIESKI